MKLSIVIAVLDSPEVVRRQVLRFHKLSLPPDVEIVLVDDGSEPPISKEEHGWLPNLKIVRHDLDALWTQPAARNYGVKHATGEYLICTDIDHILTKSLISYVYRTEYDFVKFRREVAVLDMDGELIQNEEAVKLYGFEERRLRRRGFRIQPHTNSFGIRRDLYLELGGVSEKKVGTSQYPNREEAPLKRQIKRLVKRGQITVTSDAERPVIYMIPNGRFCGDPDFNPFGLFHSTPRRREVVA